MLTIYHSVENPEKGSTYDFGWGLQKIIQMNIYVVVCYEQKELLFVRTD